MTRRLLDGTVVNELDYAVDINVHTKCPEKWKLIDMENGNEYIGTDRIENPNVNILLAIRDGLKPKASIHFGSWKKIV